MIPDGAFVRSNFPFGDPPEARSRPGPSEHIAYCLGTRSDDGGRLTEVMLAYTSSGAWRGNSPGVPLGVIEFDHDEAAKLKQRPFHLDLRCLARVPPNVAWLPGWNGTGHGVIAVADAKVQRRVVEEARRLVSRSPSIIEHRGIGSGLVTTSGRRPTSLPGTDPTR